MIPRRNVLLILSLLFLATSAPAQGGPPPPPTNILYGFITSHKTLTYASPGPVYYIVGDVVVNPGVTLTIEPGVSVVFEANRDTLAGGSFPGKCELEVGGTLVANAAAGDTIRFRSSGNGSGDWGKITIDAGGSATLAKLAISGAFIGVHNLGTLSLTGSLITTCETGVKLASTTGTVKQCTITNVSYGIDSSGGGGLVQECVLIGRGTDSAGEGLVCGPAISTAVADSLDPRPTVISRFIFGVDLGGGATLDHVIAFRNVYGIYYAGGFASNTITYCTAVNNLNTGFQLDGPQANSVYCSISALNGGTGIRWASGTCSSSGADYLESWSNGTNYSIGVCAPGPHRASFDPFFVNSAADDYHLSSGSVFKTYGPWGAEIGAYGPGPGSPVKTEASTWGRVKAMWR